MLVAIRDGLLPRTVVSLDAAANASCHRANTATTMDTSDAVEGEGAMKLAKWGLAIFLVYPLTIASAQPQDAAQSAQPQDSLAAAARRAREQKKDQPKPAKVWDNDNIPSQQGAISVVGNASAASDEASGQTQAQAAASPKQEAKPDAAAKAAELEADNHQLESLKADLDLLQRKFVLDQQSYYVKPDYSSDREGAAALKEEQDQIDAKQLQIDDLQKKIDAATGGNSGAEQK
jgi:hypothetical protein